MLSLQVIKYIAEEVQRQGDDALHVAYMCEAWEWVVQETSPKFGEIEDVSETDPVDFLQPPVIMKIAGMVEPNNNDGESFRYVNVRVGDNIKLHHSLVPRAMEQLFSFESLISQTPEEIYRQFQEIHPFRDGNGRTGKLIYNCLKGTMDNPVMPPNFWNCLNP